MNAWIRTNQPSGGAYNSSQDNLVRIGFNDSDARELITSNVIGEFKGFNSGTIIKLENGQTWRVESGELEGIKAMSNPKVTIRPGMIGGWRLQVEGYNSVAKVKRVE